jgi:hypothetical protein
MSFCAHSSHFNAMEYAMKSSGLDEAIMKTLLAWFVVVLALLTCSFAQKSGRAYHFDSVVGKPVYFCADSSLYHYEEANGKVALGTEVGRFEFPRLSPLTVERMEVVSGYAGVDTAHVFLKSSDGRRVLAQVSLYDFHEKATGADLLGSRLMVKNPFTPETTRRIQTFDIRIGMSERAASCALGMPDKINDYGTGGQQLIYDNGKTLIYIDQGGSITNIQKIE